MEIYTATRTIPSGACPHRLKSDFLSGHFLLILTGPSQMMATFGRIVYVLMVCFSTAGLHAQESDPDWLGVARRYADHMLEFGRDRYGPRHSPLFLNGLYRTAEARILDEPLFMPQSESQRKKEAGKRAEMVARYPGRTFTSFGEFDFNRVTNYPAALDKAGLHKVTVYGCDPYEDQALYGLLDALTEMTGNGSYAAARKAALVWWFENTQGPAGLYPWGEHLGWDPVTEEPTYFAGRSKGLYHAAFHEIKNATPYLDVLSGVSIKRLEDYAWGVWQAHFWEKEKAWYDRHGDYLGEDNRRGEPGGFPAHLGAYFDLWTTAYLVSEDGAFKAKMGDVMERVGGMMVRRSEKYGIYPYDFTPELEGVAPRDNHDQAHRLAGYAARDAARLRGELPKVAALLDRVAVLNREVVVKTEQPGAMVVDLSGKDRPTDHARAIEAMLEAWEKYGDRTYLDAARGYARRAYAMFCDERSPLPRAIAKGGEMRTTEGEMFGDFYWRGAELMWAFARLGAAMGEE
jgi:hypothetical protein